MSKKIHFTPEDIESLDKLKGCLDLVGLDFIPTRVSSHGSVTIIYSDKYQNIIVQKSNGDRIDLSGPFLENIKNKGMRLLAFADGKTFSTVFKDTRGTVVYERDDGQRLMIPAG